VDAIRRADSEVAIARWNLTAQSPGFCEPACAHEQQRLQRDADYARHAVLRDPELVHEHFSYGRTLLHTASGDGNATTVELLLSLGADPNVTDGAATRRCIVWRTSAASQVRKRGPRAAGSGADVNACGGVKRCTPLHMPHGAATSKWPRPCSIAARRFKRRTVLATRLYVAPLIAESSSSRVPTVQGSLILREPLHTVDHVNLDRSLSRF